MTSNGIYERGLQHAFRITGETGNGAVTDFSFLPGGLSYPLLEPVRAESAHTCLVEEQLLIWVSCPDQKRSFVAVHKNTSTANSSAFFQWQVNDFHACTPSLHLTICCTAKGAAEGGRQSGRNH